jgi:hypothetical protein
VDAKQNYFYAANAEERITVAANARQPRGIKSTNFFVSLLRRDEEVDEQIVKLSMNVQRNDRKR